MTNLPEFEVPRETLNWAANSLDEFYSGLQSFYTNFATQEFIDIDPNTGHKLYKVRLRDSIPTILSQKSFEAISHIRNSFDQSMFAAVSVAGKIPKKGNIHFPWRTNPTDLKRSLEHPKSNIPKEFWDTIAKHEPYPTGEDYSGGNNIIRELARIANQKHTTSLGVVGHTTGGRHPDITGNSIQFMRIPAPRWDTKKNEMILVEYLGDVQIRNNYRFNFAIVFQETGAVKGLPVSTCLKKFLAKAHEVLKDLESDSVQLSMSS